MSPELSMEQKVEALVGEKPQRWPRGKCEHGHPRPCGERGRWMWHGQILCAEHGPRCEEFRNGCPRAASVRITSAAYVDSKGAMGSSFFACGSHGRKYGSPGMWWLTGWVVEAL